MKMYDYVFDKRTNSYGVVLKVNKKTAVVFYDDEKTSYKANLEDLQVKPAKELTRMAIKKFARGDINYAILTKGCIPQANFYANEKYEMTSKDIDTLFYNIQTSKISIESLYYNWYEPLTKELYSIIALPDQNHPSFYQFLYIKDMIEKYLCQEISKHTIIDTRVLKKYKKNPWNLCNTGKECFINQINIDKVPDNLASEVRNLLLEYKDSDNIKVLYALAYSYYGGNNILECDWKKSEYYLLKLMELDVHNQPFYADTLGYIYYYGRTNNFVPEYDKAYHYFLLAAKHNNPQAIYKLADMYYSGKGCKKNKLKAKEIYEELYSILSSEFINHDDITNNLADVALRMARLESDVDFEEEEKTDYSEFIYYTIANYALETRLPYNQYGDVGLYLSCQKNLTRLKEGYEIEPIDSPVKDVARLAGIEALLQDNYECEFSIKKSDEDVYLSVRRLPKEDGTLDKTFICYPEYQYLETNNYHIQIVRGVELYFNELNQNEIKVDSYTYEELEEEDGGILFNYKFYYQDEVVLDLVFTYCEAYLTENLIDVSQIEYIPIVSIKFSPDSNEYDYLQNDIDCKVGDVVIVDSDDGLKEVEVVKMCQIQSNPYVELRPILRKK